MTLFLPKLCAVLIIWTLLSGENAAQTSDQDPRQASVSGKRNKHSFIVRLEKQPFQRSHHRITGDKNHPDIDGAPQDYQPLEELSRFEVTVDGSHWQVPVRLWRDCFDPILRHAPDAEHPQAVLSRDGKVLRVKLFGGDAVGSYDVTWLLKANGQITRKQHSDFRT